MFHTFKNWTTNLYVVKTMIIILDEMLTNQWLLVYKIVYNQMTTSLSNQFGSQFYVLKHN